MSLAQDEQLIEQIQQVTETGSRLLVTLARRGKALQQDEPQRAAFLLGAMVTHPLYKAGRLACDMMEIEDLILDKPDVELMSTHEVMRVLTRGAHYVSKIVRHWSPPAHDRGTSTEVPGSDRATSALSASEVTPSPSLPRVSLGPIDAVQARTTVAEDTAAYNTYPELRSADYLYDYVVLGLLDVVGGVTAFPSYRARPSVPSPKLKVQGD